MLKLSKNITECQIGANFESGLEYAAPCRGVWNISHIGFMIPESHQIFICAKSCLRGVILTAAELGMEKNFSSIELDQKRIINGSIDDFMFNAVKHIIDNLEEKPKVILIYFSCVHFFIGFDIPYFMKKIKQEYLDITFIDCYMTPTLRKTGLEPDETMRLKLYEPIKKLPIKEKTISIIGNSMLLNDFSDIKHVLNKAGVNILEISKLKTYDEYLKIGESNILISLTRKADKAVKILAKRLDIPYMYIPQSYTYSEIENTLGEFYNLLKERIKDVKNYSLQELIDTKDLKHQIDAKILETKSIIKNKKIAIDFTAVNRPISLARFLLEKGFNVQIIFTENIIKEEENDLQFIKENFLHIEILPLVDANMLFEKNKFVENEFLAIGQKAAYYTNTNYFVNIVEGYGLVGFLGILHTLDLICEAFNTAKNMRKLVGIKALDCKQYLQRKQIGETNERCQ